jgi:hypothetical protein
MRRKWKRRSFSSVVRVAYLEIFMTIDFTIGFAGIGARVVTLSPAGRPGWVFNAMRKRYIAIDGFVYLAAVRLLGVTVGCTITRDVDNSTLPQFAQPPIPHVGV